RHAWSNADGWEQGPPGAAGTVRHRARRFRADRQRGSQVIGLAVALADSGFPNPVGWTVDQINGLVGGAAAKGFELVIGGLTAWMLDAVVWVVGGVFNFFLDATDPNVQADWFLHGTGPYATTLGISAVLLVGFVLIGITQGVLAGDVGGMLRRVMFELPMAVLGMVG